MPTLAGTTNVATPCRQPRSFAAPASRGTRRVRLPQSSQHFNEAQPEPDADLSKALTDWRSFRAQLVALEQTNSALTAELSTVPDASSFWVHELSLPEKGCLLLGRMECMGQFTNAVILLCQHDSLGSSGFIINMPLPQKLLDLSTEVALAEELQDKEVYYGGPCSRGTIFGRV